jgi:tryptophan synthase alpha subunit
MVTIHAASIEVFAKEMQYETVYEDAVKKAKKEGKNIMLVMVTHYCPWCRKYERDTLSKKSVNSFVMDKYVPLILNREKGAFPKKFDTPRIPTTFFIAPKDDRLIYSEMGYKTKSEFFDMVHRVKP